MYIDHFTLKWREWVYGHLIIDKNVIIILMSFYLSSISLVYVLIPLKWCVISLNLQLRPDISQTLTGSSVISSWFSPFIDFGTPLVKFGNLWQLSFQFVQLQVNTLEAPSFSYFRCWNVTYEVPHGIVKKSQPMRDRNMGGKVSKEWFWSIFTFDIIKSSLQQMYGTDLSPWRSLLVESLALIES
jgi:hypothetical protein